MSEAPADYRVVPLRPKKFGLFGVETDRTLGTDELIEDIRGRVESHISELEGLGCAPDGVSIGSYSKGGKVYYQFTGKVPKGFKRHIGRDADRLREARASVNRRGEVRRLRKILEALA